MSKPLTLSAVLLATLALAACGSDPVKTADADAGKRIEGVALSAGVQDIAKKEGRVELEKDKRVNCEKYTPIGSHRPIYRCLTQAEKANQADSNQREMRKMTAPPPSAGSTIGN